MELASALMPVLLQIGSMEVKGFLQIEPPLFMDFSAHPPWCINWSLAKEFVLPNVKSSSIALPTSLHDACLGGVHTPVNCHRQRLLVASQKPTKVKEAAKAKAKPAAKPKPGPKPKKTQATPAAAAAGKESKTSTTAYALEKNKFLATLLGNVNACLLKSLNSYAISPAHGTYISAKAGSIYA